MIFFLGGCLSCQTCNDSQQFKARDQSITWRINSKILQWGNQSRLHTGDAILSTMPFLSAGFYLRQEHIEEDIDVVSQMCVLAIYGHMSNRISDPPCEDTLEAVKLLYIKTNWRLDVVRTSYLSLSAVVFCFLFCFYSSMIVFESESKSLLVGIRIKKRHVLSDTIASHFFPF